MRVDSGAPPPVSIGLPVYNGERYLASALESLLAQTFGDFELLIGDNASTDATREIALAYAARDERIRYLGSNENHGAAWNYNRVFAASRGRYFRWAAYDDLIAPRYLERVVEALEGSPPGCVLAHARTVFIDEDGTEIGPWEDAFDLATGHPALRLARLYRHIVKSNVLFGLVRREVLARTRLHGAFPSADYVLLGELALLGSWVVVPERLFFRRVHPAMSRLAHTRLEDVAEWFEPGSGGRVQPEFTRLFLEQSRSIVRSPIPARDRAAALGLFLPVFVRRFWRRLGDELRSELERRLLAPARRARRATR